MKMFRGLVLAGAATAALTAANPAEANGWHRRGPGGGAVAGAIIGGLALGAIAGSAYAAPRAYYAPPPPPVAYYPAPPVYYAPPPPVAYYAPPPVAYRPYYGW